MKKHILHVLKQIEIDYEVKIVYACEAGSRSWGISSIESDFDVRFIYIHKKDWYLSIDPQRDVIEIPKHDPLSFPLDPLLDVNGWDITKALKLFRKSNPSLLEWIGSGDVYVEAYNVMAKLRNMSGNIFSPLSCIHHYLQMAKKNNKQFLQGDRVKVKKYFYVLRPILAAEWIAKYGTFPPVLFHSLVEEVLPNSVVKHEILYLMQQKMAGIEDAPKNKILQCFIKEEFEKLEAHANTLSNQNVNHTNELNQLFRNSLDEVWGEN